VNEGTAPQGGEPSFRGSDLSIVGSPKCWRRESLESRCGATGVGVGQVPLRRG